jgi:hypothetical protein
MEGVLVADSTEPGERVESVEILEVEEPFALGVD